MNRVTILICFIFISVFCFAQNLRVVGSVPSSDDSRLYQIQVGAFLETRYAQNAYDALARASLNPVFERFNNFTRVIAAGIPANQVTGTINTLRTLGFTEIIIRLDTSPVAQPRENNAPAILGTVVMPSSADAPGAFNLGGVPSSLHSNEWPVLVEIPRGTTALSAANLREIGFRTLRVGESASLTDLTVNRNFAAWINSEPSSVNIDSLGNVTALDIGNAFIQINNYEYISVIVTPREDFYIVPDSRILLLPETNTGRSLIENMYEYKTEPTFRLAYRFNNKYEQKGASGPSGGIDILARGDNYEWLWTSYFQGGWFYDLNGTRRDMINGFQKDAGNGVELTIIPEFIYDNGVLYLRLKHRLYNPNNFVVRGQKFGASADIMINDNDHASLVAAPFGVYMTDNDYSPALEFHLICLEAEGVTPVSTLWLGSYGSGSHLDYIYTDRRADVYGEDSAVSFSYQDIDLNPLETKEFIIKFAAIHPGM
ncbi:MAG: hypothetical protein FWC21_03635 [Treponema sp.]|nr:hypothetical protein [Treponema sp.]